MVKKQKPTNYELKLMGTQCDDLDMPTEKLGALRKKLDLSQGGKEDLT